MSLYVPLLIILSAYFFFRFPALLVAMYYKSYRMDDYWYVVMLGVAADICLLLYLRPWIYAAGEMIEAIVIIGMLLAVMQFISWRKKKKKKVMRCRNSHQGGFLLASDFYFNA